MRRNPQRVLPTSLLWFDKPMPLPYVPLYVLFLAPAEQRLGSARWLATGLAAHVGATYASQGYLKRNIEKSAAPVRLTNARDVGVSYFVMASRGR